MKAILLIILFPIDVILAQETEKEIWTKKYEEKSILLLTSSVFPSGTKYIKNGKVYAAGFLGENLKREMKEYKEAIAEMDKYLKFKIGSILCYLPFGASVYMTFKMQKEGKDQESAYYWVGSAIALLANFILDTRAGEHLSKTAWLYNREILVPQQ